MEKLNISMRIIIYVSWLLIREGLRNLNILKRPVKLYPMTDQIQEILNRKYSHKWSGWPGAYCLKCGTQDPYEIAIADGWIDFVENSDDPTGEYLQKWDTKEHETLVEQLNICHHP